MDYFFLGKYRALLMANQEGYVVALIQAAGTIVNMAVSIVLIYMGAGVLAVKAVATGVIYASPDFGQDVCKAQTSGTEISMPSR